MIDDIKWPPLPHAIGLKAMVNSDAPATPEQRRLQLEGEEGAKWFSAHLKSTAEMLFKKQGEVRPMVLIIAQRDPETCKLLDEPEVLALGIDPTIMNAEDTKQGLANFLKAVCGRTQAIGWGFMHEGWMLEATSKEEADTLRAGYDRIADNPARIECLFVNYQHIALGDETRGLITKIKRGFRSNGQPRAQLAGWLDFPGGVSGRFAGIILSKEAREKADKFFHMLLELKMTKAEMIAGLQKMQFPENYPGTLLIPYIAARIQELDIP